MEVQSRIKHSDEKFIVYFLLQNTMSSITSQNLKLKYNLYLYIEKQKKKNLFKVLVGPA